jgi:hypothetical protein
MNGGRVWKEQRDDRLHSAHGGVEEVCVRLGPGVRQGHEEDGQADEDREETSRKKISKQVVTRMSSAAEKGFSSPQN